MTQEHYHINGLSCASCANRVEKALQASPGVQEASVNLATEKAHLTFDDSLTNFHTLRETVQAIGYDLVFELEEDLEIPSPHSQFRIEGMGCASCANKIETTLNQLAPIEQASVNLATERLDIDWDKQVDIDLITETVSQLGYKAIWLKPQIDHHTKETQIKIEKLSRQKQQVTYMIAFTLPLFILTMGPMIGLTLPRFMALDTAPLTNVCIQLALTIPVMILNRHLYSRGYRNLLAGHPNMDSLGAIGTSAAFIQGLVTTYQLVQHPSLFSQHNSHPELYYESVAVILTLMALGKYLEAIAKGKTSQAVQALLDLSPQDARLVTKDGSTEIIPTDQIQVGDILQVLAGESLPADGVITQGQTHIDESMLTGESLPVSKKIDDLVTGASINQGQPFQYRVTRVGQDSFLAQIIAMVEAAQGSKAPIAQLADKISGIFVPTVMILALLSGLAWYFLFGASFAFALKIIIAVLIIACPCALGLATPTAIMVGTGNAARHGILVKNGAILQAIQEADTLLLDKTGTITQGKPNVIGLEFDHSIDSREALRLLASLEALSEHPLGQAILAHYHTSDERPLIKVDDLQVIPGHGLSGRINADTYLVGNLNLLDSIEVDEAWHTLSAHYTQLGATPIYFAKNNQLVGLVAIADPIKASSAHAIESLKKQGLRIEMVTGDNPQTAKAIAKQVGIEQVHAGILPQNKGQIVQELQQQGHKVIMVGDGINDAPALIQADTGMAIGSGTDIAIESADLILLGDSLEDVQRAIQLSHDTLSIIKQNLFWAFAYNVVGIPFAMGLFKLLFDGPLLDPMIAALAMSFSSVTVLLNAMRLRYK